MGGVCGIGSIKGRLSPIGSLQGALSIPVGGGLDCDIYEGKYNIVPSDTVQVLPTANKLLKHDIVIEANSGGLPEGSEMATDDDIDSLIDDIFGTGVNPDPDEPTYSPNDIYKVSLLVVLSAFVGAPTSGRLFFVFTSYFIFSISSFNHSNSLWV